MAQFTTIRQYFRQNADTPWYVESETYRTHVDNVYHGTGKIISSTGSLDSDDLILTKFVEWDSEESRIEFINDPIVIAEYEARQAYHAQHGIVFNMVFPPPAE